MEKPRQWIALCAEIVFLHPDIKLEDRLYDIDGVQKVLSDKDLEELEITLSPTGKMKE